MMYLNTYRKAFEIAFQQEQAIKNRKNIEDVSRFPRWQKMIQEVKTTKGAKRK